MVSMYQEAFTKLELDEVATILDLVNPHFEGSVFDPVETTIMAQDISFYPGYRFLDIADYTLQPATRRFVIYKPDDIRIINFTNDPIYALNKDLPIALSEDNIDDYVRFFFTYIRGRHGRFLIVENVDDIPWRDDPPPQARKAVGKMIESVILAEIDDTGSYQLKASVIFKDSLFSTQISVTPGGTVVLSDEKLLIEEMPIADDTFGQ